MSNSVQDQRPLSPHLTIYKPQITSMLSILHRITGVALYAGALVFAWWIILAIYQYGCTQCIESLLFKSFFGELLLIGWSFSLYYHLLNGIRHLWWDTGRGYELSSVNMSGWLTIIGSVTLTAVTWAAVWGWLTL